MGSCFEPGKKKKARIMVLIESETDVLGSMAFSPVKTDMLGNVKVSQLPRDD